MEDDIIKLKRLFKEYTDLDYAEEEIATENTWYIATNIKMPLKFNYIPREFLIIVNLTERTEYDTLISDYFLGKLILNGLNLISSSFNDSNRYGELELSSLRKFNC